MSQLSRFFYNGNLTEGKIITLDSDTAKHIWQVLRMETGDKVILTDGNGTTAEGIINSAERHKCNVTLGNIKVHPRQGKLFHLCVCFTKNNSRNEWLLEKATELGVSSIIPMVSSRSEKTYVRNERWQKILQSAILQSNQNYLPYLAEVTPLGEILDQYNNGTTQKLVAHCVPGIDKYPLPEMLKPASETIMLVGPEGDFTADEVNLCIRKGFKPVSLGENRLRTETAAITAAAFFNVMYNEAS